MSLASLFRLGKPKLTFDDIVLAWAFDEANSPRWEARFLQETSKEHLDKVRSAPSPKDLTWVDQQIIATIFLRRRGWMINKYLRPVTQFREHICDVDTLRAMILLPEMNERGRTMEQYALSELPDNAGENDPRIIARRILETSPDFTITSAPIAIVSKYLRVPMLIEGYTRMTTFLRRCEGQASSVFPVIPCIFATNDAITHDTKPY